MAQAETMLISAGIVVTPQRVAILTYLLDQGGHPTAECIYHALRPQMPSLSLATAYNNLKLFADHGLVFELAIDPDAQRFDAELHVHGHFKCQQCGRIENFPVQLDAYQGALHHHQIHQQTIVFYGLCPSCQAANLT